MMNQVPDRVLIYHIVHVDRLTSIINDGFLWSDAETRQRGSPGTVVGMQSIKDRRLRNRLSSHPGLCVGQCVPFYFCHRSVMLYLLHKANRDGVTYRGGQDPIIHLVAEITSAANWADQQGLRWAFTLSNAGSEYAEDRCNLANLNEINWPAVESRQWSGSGIDPMIKEGKQAEFLVEQRFDWKNFIGIGVKTKNTGDIVTRLLDRQAHKPQVKIFPQWYY